MYIISNNSQYKSKQARHDTYKATNTLIIFISYYSTNVYKNSYELTAVR